MTKYDLTGSLEASVTFNIGEKEFTLNKPTVREMRAISKVFSSIDTNSQDPEAQEKASDEAMAELYKFVTPLNHDGHIKDIMDDQPMGVQVAFNDMIKKELGASS